MGRKRVGSVLLILLLLSSVAFATELFNFSIQQTKVQYPDIKIYLNIYDKDDELIEALNSDEYEISAMLGEKKADVEKVVTFKESGEGIGYIFLIDISKSLNNDKFNDVKETLQKWILEMRNNDRAAIITFGQKVNIVQNYTGNKTTLETAINDITLKDDNTRFYDGIRKAIEMGRHEDTALPDRRIIITVTDGRDDFAGGMTKNEIIKEINGDGTKNIPIYGIGVFKDPLNESKQTHLDILGEIARESKGEYYQIDTYSLSHMFEQINNSILSTHIIKLNCEDCIPNGELYPLSLTLKSGTKTLTGSTEIRLVGEGSQGKEVIDTSNDDNPPSEETDINGTGIKRIKPLLIIIGSLLLFLILITVIALFIVKKRRNDELDYDEEEVYEDTQDREKSIEKKPVVRRVRKDVKHTDIDKSKGKQAKFTVIDFRGGEKAYVVNINDTITIGRWKDCNVTIADPELSRRQCEITLKGNKLLIKDLNSTNGTLVNGVPITGRHKLENRDVIFIGQTELRITFDE